MLRILQHNCRQDRDVIMALMEMAVRGRVDVVIVQEPPDFQGYWHPMY
jgi:hypothetical protein